MPTDPLVSTAWLADHLHDPDLRVVDASWFLPAAGRDGRAEYLKAHIPGAVFFDLEEISDHADPLPHMLPKPEDFAKAMGALGVGDGDTVVVYEASGMVSASRAWWMFRVFGHEQVFVLEGGLPRWIGEGRPVQQDIPTPAARIFTPRFDPGLVRSRDQVRRDLESGTEQVIDARTADRFRGEAPEPRAGMRAGHMPGARSLFFGGLLAPDGVLRPETELTDAFHAAGVDLDSAIVASCGSGVSACMIALSLARLGRWDAAIYDGSWADWGSRTDTPIVTGDA